MKFTTARRSAILAALAEGLTQLEAAERAEITYRALRDWVTRGRHEADGAYADFAAAVDAVLTAGAHKTAAMTPEEHRGLVAERCRSGSVEAMRLYWRMLVADRRGATRTPAKPEAADPLADLNELARRRRGSAAPGGSMVVEKTAGTKPGRFRG